MRQLELARLHAAVFGRNRVRHIPLRLAEQLDLS